jgi:sec-independent protein translocase protein TatC
MDEEKQGPPAPDGVVPTEIYQPPAPEVQYNQRTDDTHGYYEDPYGYKPTATVAPPKPGVSSGEKKTVAVARRPAGGSIQKPPPPSDPPAEDSDDDGMLRMSFMEHLEELRTRIIRALMGLGVAFVLSLLFADRLWDIIREPATYALTNLHVVPPKLAMTQPMEGFSIIWMKLPLLCSIFIASPWILYQCWAFISPGLYAKERRWAIPGILTTAGLFIGGGLFAYFLAFRYGLEFLLGIGMMNDVQPVVTITEYFDLFVDVTLGVGLVFEMPVLIFFLTLIRLASPRFLIRHSRYAILAIVIIAAIVTPTPDVFNLMLFAVPMTLLYFVGVFAGYLLVLRREGKSLPWKKIILWTLLGVLVIAAVVAAAIVFFHIKPVRHWPFLTR